MRLGIPDKVKIGGLIHECRPEPNLGRDRTAAAQSCSNGLWIRMDPSLPRPVQESSLLHEILELANNCYEVGLEHRQISVLEAVLYQVLQDNPGIFGPGLPGETEVPQ